MSDETIRDLHAYGGILLFGVGSAAYDWRVGLIALGVSFAYLGIFHFRGAR